MAKCVCGTGLARCARTHLPSPRVGRMRDSVGQLPSSLMQNKEVSEEVEEKGAQPSNRETPEL